MVQKPNSNDEHEEPAPYSNDEHDSDLSLLSHDKQPFYLRLLQRDNSSRGFSSRRRLTPSLVPFLWESSPGLPKPHWLNLNSDHHDDTANYSLAPPPIMQHHHHHMICSFASARKADGELRSADESWLRSQIKTAFRRRRTASISSMLLMGSSSPSVVGGRDESPRSTLDMQGPLCSSSSSSDSEHYLQVSGSARKLRECNSREKIQMSRSSTYKPVVQLSSRLNKKSTSSKIKSCCCFHIPDSEL